MGDEGAGDSRARTRRRERRRGAPAIATYVALIVVIAAVMPVAGLDPYDLRWGLESRIRGASDVWRVFGYAFVHGDAVHLVSNALGLWLGGRPLERMIGSPATIGLLAMGALGGAMAFIAHDAPVVAVGASGAVFAVAGAAVVAAVRGWRTLTWSTRMRLASPVLLGGSFLALGELEVVIPLFAYELAFSRGVGAVHLVHAVGLAIGVAAALWLLAPEPWRGAPRRPRALLATCSAVALGAIALALVRRAEPPVSEAELTACQAGDRAECGRLRTRFERDCSRGDPEACHNFAWLLEHGLGGPADAATAATVYERACEANFVGSCLNLAIALWDDESADAGRTRAFARRACEGGFGQGCNIEGVLLLRGHGSAQDLAAARRAFGDGCRAEFALACRNLALLKMDGVGGEREPAEALRLLDRACASGQDPGACTHLERARARLVDEPAATPAADVP